MIEYTDWTHWVGFKRYQPIRTTPTYYIGYNGTSTWYVVASGYYLIGNNY